MSVSLEKAKINNEIVQQLAQLRTSVDLVVKQTQESVHAVVHQPPRVPMYGNLYFNDNACFVRDQALGF